MSTGVTDFIVAAPAGHIRAAPAGSFKAGDPGEVKISPAGHVPVSPAGHVPIDTSPARVMIDTSQARLPWPGGGGASGGGFSNVDGGGIGGGGGGGGRVDSPTGTGGSGGAANQVIILGNAGGFLSANTGETHFTPGGTTNPDKGGVGYFIPGGMSNPTPANTSIYTPGGNVPVGGRSLIPPTPSGNVPIGGRSLIPPTPSGHVPMSMGGSHYVAGGHVPMTPKLGIDPNVEPARVNPPRPGKVHPTRLTNWHGPQDQHTQNWPRDQYEHLTTQKAWEPKELKHIWEPPKAMDSFLTTDVVDGVELLNSIKTKPVENLGEPSEQNRYFDFSITNEMEQTIAPTQNTTFDLEFQTNSESHYAPDFQRNFESAPSTTHNVDNSSSRQVDSSLDATYVNNSKSQVVMAVTVNYDAGSESNVAVDQSRNPSTHNDFSQHDTDVTEQRTVERRSTSHVNEDNRSSEVRFSENRELAVDNSREVRNDFSEHADISSFFDNSVVRNVENVYNNQSENLVNFVENRTLALDDSRTINNDFSERVNRTTDMDTTYLQETTLNYVDNRSPEFEIERNRAVTMVTGSLERGAGGLVSSEG